MARPKKSRMVTYNPEVSYFKPRGIPMIELEEVRLTIDEREAIRLADLLGLSYEEAGDEMNVSRATFGRIVQNARKIIADAIINGKSINVGGGNYRFSEDPRIFICELCKHRWDEPKGTGRPRECPKCRKSELHRIWEESRENMAVPD